MNNYLKPGSDLGRELSKLQLIERSIIKKFREQLWNPFIRGVKRYEQIQPMDKIAVCISGGKDSMLMAKLMQQLQRHSNITFELAFQVMDPGYSPENLNKVVDCAEELGIPVTVFSSNIFDTVSSITKGSPCYLCARMRRGNLYKYAQDMGCNKIALGHHMNDVIETTVMGMFYGAQLQAMLPKLHSTNFAGMQLIRPMYNIRERDIRAWRDYNKLEFIACACRFTENCDIEDEDAGGSKRKEIKRLIKQLAQTNPGVENNIFQSIHNAHLDTLPGYKAKGVEHSFLEMF